MAYTIGTVSSVLTVEEKHRILIDESLNQDSVYIRLKETLLDLLDNGEITEAGTHAELEEKKGIYYKLKELQTKALALRGLD